MYQLKDIAAAMDDCHPRTAKRWWKKLDREQRRAGKPRVRPDVRGHRAHRWEAATFHRLIALWKAHEASRGTTLALRRAKFAGHPADKKQLTLFK